MHCFVELSRRSSGDHAGQIDVEWLSRSTLSHRLALKAMTLIPGYWITFVWTQRAGTIQPTILGLEESLHVR